jgi:hypothetical protein
MITTEISFYEGDSGPVPAELVGLTAADRIEAVAFEQHCEGGNPPRGRVTLRITRAAPAAEPSAPKA